MTTIDDLFTNEIRWCYHTKNIVASADLRDEQRRDDNLKYWHCLDCGDYFPLIGDTGQWRPKQLTVHNNMNIFVAGDGSGIMVQLAPIVEGETISFSTTSHELVTLDFDKNSKLVQVEISARPKATDNDD